jgi:hypothetical protein
MDQTDVVKICTALYHRHLLDELLHYHVVVASEDQVHAPHLLGELQVCGVAHVGQSDDQVASQGFPQVFGCAIGKDIAIFKLEYVFVLIVEDAYPVRPCDPHQSDPQSIFLNYVLN